MILQLAQTDTDKGVLITEGDLIEGAEVFIEDENGELIPASDGDYETDSQIITVVDGKVTEIKDKEKEEEVPAEVPATEEEVTEEPKQEESLSKQKFDAVKAKFEASYQEVQENIYKALDEQGIWGYIIENTNEYAIVSVFEDEVEHLYKYSISVDEEGNVTLGERIEVRIEFVPVDEPKEEVTEEPKEEEPVEEKVEEFNDTPAFIENQNNETSQSLSLAEVVKRTYTK